MKLLSGGVERFNDLAVARPDDIIIYRYRLGVGPSRSALEPSSATSP